MPLVKTFGYFYFIAGFYQLVNIGLNLSSPQVLLLLLLLLLPLLFLHLLLFFLHLLLQVIDLFITYVEEKEEEWKGWVYTGLLVLISLGKAFFDTRSLTSPPP